MLARRLGGILPPLTPDESLEVTTIHSVAGLLPPGEALIRCRPFRAPHHTVSRAGLAGGGSPLRPGEVSLAHHGVLFLDELPEFSRGVLEALRQPMEDGWISVVRARERLCFPSRFMLVAAMNPCECGHLGDARRSCTCDPTQVVRYRSHGSPAHFAIGSTFRSRSQRSRFPSSTALRPASPPRRCASACVRRGISSWIGSERPQVGRRETSARAGRGSVTRRSPPAS